MSISEATFTKFKQSYGQVSIRHLQAIVIINSVAFTLTFRVHLTH